MSLHIRSRVKFGIGASASPFTSGYVDPKNAYDFAVGGVPFLSGMSRDTPAVIKSADFRRTQIDQSVEPGEQSLTGWWVRSQLSFHAGAGLQFSDPSLDESAPTRFKASEGVNVWTPGQVTLLPLTEVALAQSSSSPSLLVGGNVAGQSCVVYANALAAGYVLDNGTNFAVTPAGAPTHNWQAITSDGGCFYFVNTEGVWKLQFTAITTYTFIKMWTIPAATTVTIGWAKGRLMLGLDEKIYELIPPAGATPYALPAAPVFTALAVGWTWTSFTSGPEAIYASGFSGNRGTILRILVDEQGALPVLTGATEVAQLPTGEYPLCIRTYLGTKMGIGTTLGFRVAEISAGGELAYGPLTNSDAPVYDMVGLDRFVYYTDTSTTGNSGLVRVDLSVLNPSGRYAYATDLKLPGAHRVDSVAVIGQTNRIAFATGFSGIWFSSATKLVVSGYLLTAQTRYNTLWGKLFKRLSVRAQILGHLVVSTVDKNANEVTVASLDDNSDLEPDLSINAPDSPQESLGLRFILQQKTTTVGPTFRGYQFKALPGGPRQYTYMLPVLCFDSEKDGQGGVMGYKGYGSERLTAIQELASQGTVVLFEDLGSGFSVLVTIQEIEFNQISPGGMTQSPWGGLLTLNMRTLD